MVNAQEWLEQNYPDNKWTRIIYLNQQLEGVLDCSEYENLSKIYISIQVDGSKLEIKNASYNYYEGKHETQIIPCISAPDYLNQNYPQDGTCIRKQRKWNSDELENHKDFGKKRAEITSLYIKEMGLEGTLDFSDFTNLKELDCFDNFLTNLNLNNCEKLKEIDCRNNQLTTLDLSNLEQLKELDCFDNFLTQIPYLPNPEKITKLYIINNNLSLVDLTIFSPMRNLKDLGIGNTDENKISQGIYNRVEGSVEPLKDLNKLQELRINNTDITSGWEYLPDSLERIYYKSELRPNCKLALAETELEQVLWIDIHEDFISPSFFSHDRLLKKDWLAAGFSKEQTKEWLTVGARANSGDFINWFLNSKILPSAGNEEDVNKLGLEWAKENEEEFKDWRGKYENFGTCFECEQPSIKWCHSCNAKHFEAEFSNWTSGNQNIDQFIQKCQLEATSAWNVLEWIPYEKFTNLEHLADGGFGQVYKAQWEGGSIGGRDKWERGWKRYGDYDYDKDTQQVKHGIHKNYRTVALKTLTNSQNLNQNFLQELTLYKMFRSSVSNMVPCYGVSQDKEGNYILVMEYMAEGNLREYLRKNYQELGLQSKLNFLKQIIQGLKDIHRKKLVHRDFHSGNIIVDSKYSDGSGFLCRITDLGLSKPADEAEQENKIYGVMPYVAPEVLQNKPYTPASDIYSLGIIAYELITGCPPFYNEKHGVNLALAICRGERPQFPSQVKYPQILVDLITRCWDQEPNNRPTAREVSSMVEEWFEYGSLKTDTELYQQIQEAEEYNKTLSDEIKYPTYQSQEVWHSKSINTKQITEKLKTIEYSKSLAFDFTNLKVEEKEENTNNQNNSDWTIIHSSFTDELIQQWKGNNFTYEQCKEWINIGLQPTDYNFCVWLRDNKNYTPEQVLNHSNLEQLNQEYFQWWQEQQLQTHQEIPPKKN